MLPRKAGCLGLGVRLGSAVRLSCWQPRRGPTRLNSYQTLPVRSRRGGSPSPSPEDEGATTALPAPPQGWPPGLRPTPGQGGNPTGREKRGRPNPQPHQQVPQWAGRGRTPT